MKLVFIRQKDLSPCTAACSSPSVAPLSLSPCIAEQAPSNPAQSAKASPRQIARQKPNVSGRHQRKSARKKVSSRRLRVHRRLIKVLPQRSLRSSLFQRAERPDRISGYSTILERTEAEKPQKHWETRSIWRPHRFVDVRGHCTSAGVRCLWLLERLHLGRSFPTPKG
jgi:hypothetical protein